MSKRISPTGDHQLQAVIESDSDPESLDRFEAVDSFAPRQRVVGEEGEPRPDEAGWLLQRRIRAAAVVLMVGFGLAFVRSLFIHRITSPYIIFQGLMLVVLATALVSLSSRWRPSIAVLRIFETIMFLLVVSFYLAAEYSLILRGVAADDAIQAVRPVRSSVHWILATIFTYAIFIPNTWRRASLLILPMTFAPLAVPWVLGYVHPEFYRVAFRVVNLERSSEDALFLLLGAFTAVFGTHTINTLRAQVHEARMMNQYRLGRKLGRGGMGEVYLAEHQLLKRPCAIKLIRNDMVGNPRVFARFEREVRAAARLSHANTIEIFDYGRNHDGSFYYVMEYLPGLSLLDLVERYGPLPAARVIYLLLQACDALSEAHAAGLIHRDIKPANLMAAHRGGRWDVLKLLDFGLVKTLSENRGSQLSREGTVVGSPLYMAPEQIIRDRPPDQRTDIYALGAVAYFLLTGRPPFNHEDPMVVMIAHTRDPVAPPSTLRDDVPQDLEELVMRALKKDPRDRPHDAREFATALAACRDAGGWSPEQAQAWWRDQGIDLDLDPYATGTAEDEPTIATDDPTPEMGTKP